MPVYNEVRLGATREREVLIGSLLGAAAAVVAVWFVTVLIFSLA